MDRFKRAEHRQTPARQFNSEEYFNLLTKHPEAGPWLALGQNVVLTLDDTVYEIAE
jgi:hypothetical protein